MTRSASPVCACGQPLPESVDGRTDYRCSACGRMNYLAASAAGTAVLEPSARAATSAPLSRSRILKPITGDVPRRLGPYRLVAALGKGGMGSVYVAQDELQSRTVAVKVLNREYWGNADFTTRFHREARAAGSLSHRNIVQIFQSGVEDGVPYFAMEFVDGQNLEEILLERGPLAATQAIDFMIQTAEGLRAAAARGIIHRDIKPTNLLVVPDGVLKIADFGLAKSMDFDSRLTVTGSVIGTPYYMSPEQGQGGTVDARSDIYSLGATFYHLLTGDPPFQAETPVAIILKHLNEPLPSLVARRSDLPPTLVAVVTRMLAKSAAERHGDYDELIADLAVARAGRSMAATSIHIPLPLPKAPVATNAKVSILHDEKPPPRIVLKRSGVVRWGMATAIDVGLLTLAASFANSTTSPITLVLAAAYFVFGDAYDGRTLGKMFLRVRVADAGGNAIGIARSLVRFALFAPTLAAVALYVPFVEAPLRVAFSTNYGLVRAAAMFAVLIDLGYAFLSRERRPVHDLAVNAFLFREMQVKIPKAVRAKAEKQSRTRLKSPRVAALCGLVPGLGQVYNGQLKLGLFYPFLVALFFIKSRDAGLPMTVWGIAFLHAVLTARRLRQIALQQMVHTQALMANVPSGAFVHAERKP
ncbi:MAG: protein kinase [Planctomycetota bacterium]